MNSSVYLLAFLLFAVPLSCTSRKYQLADEWKIGKVKIPNYRTGKYLTIDLDHIEKSKKDLTNFLSERHTSENGFEPMDGQAEKMLSTYKRATLSFLDSHRFIMYSYGSIIPVAIPGWHLGDTVAGRWNKRENVMTLTVGMNEMGPSFKFRIAEERDNLLRLSEIISPEGETGAEYTLFR